MGASREGRRRRGDRSEEERGLGVVWSMGWLPLVGSLKLYVSFAVYILFYRALLQKRPITLRSLLIVATPYSIPLIGLFCKRAVQKRPIILRSLLIVATP